MLQLLSEFTQVTSGSKRDSDSEMNRSQCVAFDFFFFLVVVLIIRWSRWISAMCLYIVNVQLSNFSEHFKDFTFMLA